MEGLVLHADMNAFYVSCEMSQDPGLRGRAVVVGGDVEARHGIVLAKSEAAKKWGVRTGHVIWQAKKLCPDLIVLPPNYALYLRVSGETRAIFMEYTPRVEPFGIDEAWLGLGTDSADRAVKVAGQIRQRIRDELGITASVGVANNKIFAKLGSDYKKPDATTLIMPGSYESMVWPLPASDLLYVGRATQGKLRRIGITTIGGIAGADPQTLRQMLGVNGEMLWRFAKGLDRTPVCYAGSSPDIKSVGHSTTTPRDLTTLDDVTMTFWVLAEAVAQRLREQRFRASTVQISVRDNRLSTFERQMKLQRPTQLARDIAQAAMALFRDHYDFATQPPLRSLGVRGTNLETVDGCVQLSFIQEEKKRINQEIIEHTMDDIRRRFGHFALMRASLLTDGIGQINPRDDHVIHPVGLL